MRVIGKRFRDKKPRQGTIAKMTRKSVGRLVVIRYTDDGYQINPKGTGTKELDSGVEESIRSNLIFSISGRFPIVPEGLIRAGILVSFEGF